MDNKITILGIAHFKKINNIKSNEFRLSYLSSDREIKIKNIKVIASNEVSASITNGMLIIITGQLLYSEDKDRFIVRVDKVLPIKDRSGLAEDTILIQYGNNFNTICLSESANDSDDNDFIQTHPKPIPGNIEYNGLLKKESLMGLNLWIDTKLNLEFEEE